MQIKWYRNNVYFMLSYHVMFFEFDVAIKYKIFPYGCLNNLLM